MTGAQTIFVSALAFSGAAGAGQEGPVLAKVKKPWQSEALSQPRATIQQTAQDIFQDTFTYSAVAGTSGSSNLQAKRRIRVAGSDWGTFDTYANTPRTSQVVTRDVLKDSFVQVVVRDVDRNNLESPPVEATVISVNRLLEKQAKIDDASGDFPIFRHEERGLARDTDAVLFANDFEGPPGMTFIPQVARTYETAITAKDQILDMAAENLTTSGFDLRAKILVDVTGSAETDGFSTTRNASAPENGVAAMSSEGDVVYSNLEGANATTTTYDAYFDVDTTLMDVGNDVIVELYTSSAATGGTFLKRDQRTYAAGLTLSDEKLSVTIALGVDFDLRLRITYAEPPGSNLAAVDGLGEDSTPKPGVEFQKITGGTATSMTPSAQTKVRWIATESRT